MVRLRFLHLKVKLIHINIKFPSILVFNARTTQCCLHAASFHSNIIELVVIQPSFDDADHNVRLVPATSDVPQFGIVEVQHLGVWGRISEDAGEWTDEDATTVCVELGYTTGIGSTV